MYDIAHLDLPPLRRAAGTVRLPGSKSISNRVLLLAGLSEGTTADPRPARFRRHARHARGAAPPGLRPRASAATIGACVGIGGRCASLRDAVSSLFLGNAGTAMRPLAAALALLVTRDGGDIELSGVARMHERPIGDLVDALRQLGRRSTTCGHEGFPPLRLRGSPGGTLRIGQPIRVRGDVSSQFLTALLLALPLASGGQPIVIEVDGELISKPYVEITLALLQRFGIVVQREGLQRFTVPGRQPLPRAGAASTSRATRRRRRTSSPLGAIAAVEAPLRIEGVGLDSIQGDIRFIDAARRWAPAFRRAGLDRGAARRLAAEGSDARLQSHARRRDDAGHDGAVRATAARTCATSAAGASRKPTASPPWPPSCASSAPPWSTAPTSSRSSRPPRGARAALHTYDDHRMAMCLSLAAFNPLAGGRVPVRILDPALRGQDLPGLLRNAVLGGATPTPRDIPVITVDGPTASGKGTLAAAVAARLGWHQLDSGALYRATALAAMRQRHCR